MAKTYRTLADNPVETRLRRAASKQQRRTERRARHLIVEAELSKLGRAVGGASTASASSTCFTNQ